MSWLTVTLFIVAFAVLLFLPVWSALASRNAPEVAAGDYEKLEDVAFPLHLEMQRIETAALLPADMNGTGTDYMAARARIVLQQMATIISRVETDRLACVRPLVGLGQAPPAAQIVLPEHAAFGRGPAVLSSTQFKRGMLRVTL